MAFIDRSRLAALNWLQSRQESVMRLLTAIVFAAGLIGTAAPAHAQSAGEKVNQLIIYGDDPCPKSTGDEITVCARKDEGERYRIPRGLRDHVSPSDEAWNNKVLSYETVGAAGTQSCSPTGAGGWTGCSAKLINAAYAEKRQKNDVQFSKMIEEERAKRLSTVDADAAATQARVEQAEKDYDARQRATQDGAESAEIKSPPNN
jgi:hypothetical protein